MKVYIIRHGETSWNVEYRMQGRTDVELNENGIKLAEITSENMKDIPFDVCFSSPSEACFLPWLADEEVGAIHVGQVWGWD